MKNIKKRKGMTLIEVVVAMTILTIISVPLLTTISMVFKVTAKKKISIEENAIIRIAKENTVEMIKGGTAKRIESYKDRNGDSIVDDNDSVYWISGTPGNWNIPEDSNQNKVENLKIRGSEGNYYERYKMNIIYDNSYSDTKLPNIRKFKIEIFTRNPSNVSEQGKNIKSFNVFVDTKY